VHPVGSSCTDISRCTVNKILNLSIPNKQSKYTDIRISKRNCIRPVQHFGRVERECDGTRKRTGGEVKGKRANGGGSQQSCTVSDTVYPALLPLMRTPRLPAAD